MLNKLRDFWVTQPSSRSIVAVRRRRQFVSGLELLEERAVPSTFIVTTTRDVVAADGKMSLREAITAANAHPGADTIVLRPGVYALTRAGADDTNVAGDLDVTDSTVFRGNGASNTIVDGQQLDRVFDVLGTAPHSIKVTFEGLTIRNGVANGDGGGIRVANADLVVQNSIVNGNRASANGGGIASNSLPETGSVTVVHSIVSNNMAGGEGGGIFTLAVALTGSAVNGNSAQSGGGIETFQATISGSTISNNHATQGSGGGIRADGMVALTSSVVNNNSATIDGGGISAGVSATVTKSTLSGNTAKAGGGIDADTVIVANSTISGNRAVGGDGGGISSAVTTVTGSTLSGNFASTDGGAIAGDVQTLTNSTISGNTAHTGGGLAVSGLTLQNVTITRNTAHTGGGVALMNAGVSSVRNTIVAQNSVDPGGVGPDVSGSFSSGGHNLIGVGSGATGFVNGMSGDQVGTAMNPINARLAPLANNGGTTMTHALLPGSPAIDRGDNNHAPHNDQRGVARPRDGDRNGSRIVDIGAFEK
jgi:hypothetical protein